MVRHYTCCTSCRNSARSGSPTSARSRRGESPRDARRDFQPTSDRCEASDPHGRGIAASACQSGGAGGDGGQRGSYRAQDARARRAFAPDSRQRGRGNSADRSVPGADIAAVGSRQSGAPEAAAERGCLRRLYQRPPHRLASLQLRTQLCQSYRGKRNDIHGATPHPPTSGLLSHCLGLDDDEVVWLQHRERAGGSSERCAVPGVTIVGVK